MPHLDRGIDRTIRGASSGRHETAPRARAVALHRTAALRCGTHGPPAHQGRRAHGEAAKDRHRVAADPGASALASGAQRHAERAFDVLGHHHRKPYGPNHFSESFREWCDAAGLPQRCKPHGLRKAACRRLAEAGCSANEIMAISGHATMKELVRYTKAADRALLARNAMAKAVIR